MNTKRTLLISCAVLLLSFVSIAQSPAAFKYQAVARDGAGLVLNDQSVSFQISILQNSVSGTTVYSETHDVSTNGYGLVTLNIGNGVVISGDFSAISWGADSYFLQIEMDETGGSSYQLLGTSQLMSVPYAIHAKTAESVPNDSDGDSTNELQELSINGNDLTIINGNTITLPDAVNDADADPMNEIELPIGGSDGQILSTDGVGNYSWVDDQTATSTTTYAIGDLAHGGIVFYVNPEGTHGLVAANINQHNYETWYDVHDLLSDPSNHDPAGANYFDWRLPSRWESTKMYENLKANGLGNLDDFGYWIGVEYSPDKAYCEDMIMGGQLEVDKTTHFLHVRAVRVF